MSKLTKSNKVGIFAIFIAAAMIASVATLGDNMAYAGGKNKKHNDAEQEIEQGQWSSQNSQCVSGTFTAISCNNLGFQFQNNEGNLALGQQ